MSGLSIELILAVVTAALVRVTTNKATTFWAAAITLIVGIAAGLVLYGPILAWFGLSASAEIPIAIIVALTGENLMRSIIDISSDGTFIKRILKNIINGWLEK